MYNLDLFMLPYINSCTHLLIYSYIYTLMCIFIIYLYIYICIYIYIYLFIHIYVYIYIFVTLCRDFSCTNIYIYMKKIHIYIYICIYFLVLSLCCHFWIEVAIPNWSLFCKPRTAAWATPGWALCHVIPHMPLDPLIPSGSLLAPSVNSYHYHLDPHCSDMGSEHFRVHRARSAWYLGEVLNAIE